MQGELLIAIPEKFSAGSIAELDFQEGTIRLPRLPRKGTGGESVISPSVARFHGSAGPDSPPFAAPGSSVKAVIARHESP